MAGRKPKPPMSPRVGQVLRVQREELGLTQEALGKKIGLSKYSINKYEQGITLPSGIQLIRMAKVYGMSAGDLARRIYTVIEEEMER